MTRRAEMHEVDGEFQECAPCAAKRGSPELCQSCYSNRTLIWRLEESNRKLRRRLHATNAITDALLDHVADKD